MPAACAVLGEGNMDPVTRSRAEELLRRIKRHATPSCKKRQSVRQGVHISRADGAPLGVLRQLAKGLPRPDQDLADALWQTRVHGARVLAVLLADPLKMTVRQLTLWAEEADAQDVCDLCAAELFAKTKNPFALAERWIKKERELTRRAGFCVLCALAAPRAKTPEEDLAKIFPLLKNGAADERPAVYKAVNKALRTAGKRSPALAQKALACADEICYLFEHSRTARWVAQNARLELEPKPRPRRK